MAFWSSERIHHEQPKEIKVEEKDGSISVHHLIDKFEKRRVKSGKYELRLSREVIVTPDGTGNCPAAGVGPTLTIPAGQYAILYTQERVTVPNYAIAFISIKFGNTYKGLVNISGFHVDPGFSGHLKFSVYNAGNHPIFLDYESECFQIWFADLSPAVAETHPTKDPYDGEHKQQCKITPEDRSQMSDKRHSPAALNERLESLEGKIATIYSVGILILLPMLIGLAVAIFDHWFGEKSQLDKNGELFSLSELSVIGLVLLSFAIVICYFIIIRVSRWLYFWMSRRKSK